MKPGSPERWPCMGALTTQSPASTRLRTRSREGAALACKLCPGQLHLTLPAWPRQTRAFPSTGLKETLDPCGPLPWSLNLGAYSRGTSMSAQPAHSAPPTLAATPRGSRDGR